MTPETILSAVAAKLATGFPSAVLMCPGDVEDLEAASEFIAMDLPSIETQVHRKSGKQLRRSSVRIDVWVKPGGNTYRCDRLAAQVTAAFRHAEIAIGSSDGWLRLLEPRRTYMTRTLADALRTEVRMVRLVFPVLAQEV